MFYLNPQLAEPQDGRGAGVYKDCTIIHNNIQYNIGSPGTATAKPAAIGAPTLNPLPFSTDSGVTAQSLVEPPERKPLPDPAGMVSSDTVGQQASDSYSAQANVGPARSLLILPEVASSGTLPEWITPKLAAAALPDGPVNSGVLTGAVKPVRTSSSDQESSTASGSPQTCAHSFSRSHSNPCEILPLLDKSLRMLERQMSQNHEEIGRLRLEKDKEIDRLVQEKDKEIDRLKQEKDKEISRLKQETDREIDRLMQEKGKEIDRLTQEKDKEIDRLRQEEDKEIDRLRQEKDEEIDRVRQEKDEEIDRLTQECGGPGCAWHIMHCLLFIIYCYFCCIHLTVSCIERK